MAQDKSIILLYFFLFLVLCLLVWVIAELKNMTLTYEHSEEEEEDIEYVDPAELAKKPIDELDRDELKILAEYKGIDISGITSTKKLRAALRDME